MELIDRINEILKSDEINESESIKSMILKQTNEEIRIEKDAIGRDVFAEAENDQDADGTDNTENDQGSEGNEEDKPELKPGETTTLQNFDEFFKRTDTNIKITKDGKEPSPLFGTNDTNDHNKYTVTITNSKGGSISWTYWDSLENTNSNKEPDVETVMRDFGQKLEMAVVGMSIDNFKKQCGYEETEDNISQQQYNNLRKMKDNIKKIYPDEHQVYELIQVAKKV